MEHMESKMQDFYEAAEQREKETYAAGFKAGMLQAVQTLRIAAGQHCAEAADSRKVVESSGHLFAQRILASYANGLEMDAEKAR